MEKEMKITPPEGYEIDRIHSTFECIKFKQVKKHHLPFYMYPIPIIPESERKKILEKRRTFTPLKEGVYEEGDILSNDKGTIIYVFKKVIPPQIWAEQLDFEYYIELSKIKKLSLDFNGKSSSIWGLRPATKEERQQLFKALCKLVSPEGKEVDFSI